MALHVSAVMLTHNSEDTIEKALLSLKWADEIIVYDSGSDDNTAKIARRHKAKVLIDTKWEGFGPQRQKAQAKALPF